ncbi:aminopeptidase C [Facklamia sp. P12932]|uniref:aminopeptidase C n=1 Tax=Facklamia sp. P12932 TaxID=3421947 RepID=UPI003D185DED
MTINQELIQSFKTKYQAETINHAVENAVAKVGFNQSSFNNEAVRDHTFVFSDETKRGKITDQKKSGRCWMFAALNGARVNTMEELNLETFEFSQNYTLFWDKLEKSNFFLDSIIETVEEPLNSRVVQHLLQAPVEDGGQWDMFTALLQKYGSVPKSVMPETYHSSNTYEMVAIITKRLRAFAKELRTAYQNKASKEDLKAMKEDMLYVIYNILVKALGQVPEKFSYSYRDKDGKYHRIEDITPQDFFNKYVGWDLEGKVSVINAPTEDKPFGRAFTVKYLASVAEGHPITYINAPIEVLKEAAIASIKDGKPVWFGCDVGKMSDRELGIMDKHLYEYEAILAEAPQLNKAERLDYGESLLTHAMLLVGVDLDADGKPVNWKVENSWGEKSGDKGIFSMSDQWFDEYNYQVTVDKKYLDQKWLDALNQPVIELEPWDPMGSLADWN